MTRTKLKLIKYRQKPGASYCGFYTNLGWMNCFDAEMIADLKAAEGRIISVTTSVKNSKGKDFTNIVGYHGIDATVRELDQVNQENQAMIDSVEKGFAGAKVASPQVETPTIKETAPISREDDIIIGTSISYAKDVYCAEIAAGIPKEERTDVKAKAKYFIGLQQELRREA